MEYRTKNINRVSFACTLAGERCSLKSLVFTAQQTDKSFLTLLQKIRPTGSTGSCSLCFSDDLSTTVRRGQQKQATVDSVFTPVCISSNILVLLCLFSPLKALLRLRPHFQALVHVSTLACYEKCMVCLCELIKTHFCPAPVISLPAALQQLILSAQLTKLDVIRIHEKCFFLFSAGTISRSGQAGGPADESVLNPFSLGVKLNLLWTVAIHFKICAK